MNQSFKKERERKKHNNRHHTLISLKRGVAAAELTAERERRVARPLEMNMVKGINKSEKDFRL